jgi:hypothetical protein
MTDTSAQNTAKVIAQDDPTDPRLAALFSFLRTVGIVATGVLFIWTHFRTHDLAGNYEWAHSSDAVAWASAAGSLFFAIYGPAKKYLDKKRIKQQSTVINTIANAPAHEAVATIVALRESGTPAAPITPPAPPVDAAATAAKLKKDNGL